MRKDHYVARTYLKHFADEKLGGMLHAYRKSDGAEFRCRPKDVCHEWDGDLNAAYLVHPQLLGDFRKIFEPHWNAAMGALKSCSITASDKFILSAGLANFVAATPAFRRCGVEMHNRFTEGNLRFAKKMKEKHGGLPNLPIDAIELLEKGEIRLDTDPDYIKAMTTRQLLEQAWAIYNQDWFVIQNHSSHLFLTSDNPAAVLESGDIRKPMTHVLPVTPKLSVSVTCTNLKLKPFDAARDLGTPPLGEIRYGRVDAAGAKMINKLIVRCAEDVVFSSEASSGVAALVKKYARHRVVMDYVELPADRPDSIYQGAIMRVREIPWEDVGGA